MADHKKNIKEEKGHVKLDKRKESIAVEKADEGDSLMAKRVLIGFQRFEIEPKEDFLPSDENTIILVSLSVIARPYQVYLFI